MPRFEHPRVLILQDDQGVWARFVPAVRMVDGADVRYGALETSDEALVRRLRAAMKTDPRLVEVRVSEPEPESEPEPKARTRARAK